jgi:SAM-dependent methyltransferase
LNKYVYQLETMLGSVESIISHVKPDWWTSAFQETYLRTDGDVVENPAITESECLEILNNPLVKVLWTKNAEGTDGVLDGTVKVGDEMKRDVSSLHVLDLCCGQGWHTICLAQHLPGAKFHGHDHSVFLVDLARARVRAAGLDGDVVFTTGYAKDVPVRPETFDIVLMMGNSLGYGESVDDAETLREVYRGLKPGGLFLLDLPDANRMIDSVKDRSWEWIDGRDLATLMANEHSEPHLDGAYDCGKNNRKLLACRERELSAKKDKLATRELVIDLERGIVEDLFYSVHLYKLTEIADLLWRCGLFTSTDIPHISTNNTISKQPRPDSSRDEDLGMMEHRYLVVAQKPNFIAQDLTISIDDDLDFYVHPTLTIRSDPYKGKLICATANISAGTLLIVDKPYACVPSIDPVPGEWFHCSRDECSRRIPRTADAVSGRVACLRHCNPEVVWCNSSCRDLDEKRHALECEWLAAYTNVIVNRHGKYDFNMLWLVARILVRRRCELQQNDTTIPADLVSVPDGKGSEDPAKRLIEVQPTDAQSSSPPFGNNTWPIIQDSILSNRDRFPPQRIEHWNFLALRILPRNPSAAHRARPPPS